MIDIWNPKTADTLNPDDTVFAVWADIEGCGELMFGYGYSTKSEASIKCFWVGTEKTEIVKYTAREFVKLHNDNVRGMNPFFTIGRIDFMKKWRLVINKNK